MHITFLHIHAECELGTTKLWPVLPSLQNNELKNLTYNADNNCNATTAWKYDHLSTVRPINSDGWIVDFTGEKSELRTER